MESGRSTSAISLALDRNTVAGFVQIATGQYATHISYGRTVVLNVVKIARATAST